MSPFIYYVTEFEGLINKRLDKLFQNSHFSSNLYYQFLLLIYKPLMKCTIYYALIFKILLLVCKYEYKFCPLINDERYFER